MTAHREIAPAKLNLALHVRGKLPDGRHAIETIFAFCTDGDRLSGEPAGELTLDVKGPFAGDLPETDDNLVLKAARALRDASGVSAGAAITLDKRLPVASGIGGGSADAAAALRLLTSLWRIDPKFAQEVAPSLGSDVPACLLSLPARGDGAGDRLTPIALPDLWGTPVLLVNPGVPLSTAEVFARWDCVDCGALDDWREGRNDLREAAIALVPQIGAVLEWLALRRGATFVRLSGSGATCFALFESEDARDSASDDVPPEWWRLATFLR
ncbi:MAG TPA: 4-(cytidine 5'-diphospho)-2-C-methyl-D-erythritol kinase [Sphingomicrobium sp.]|nr:4-(cytidine 5'-diphospho)-2-C-methyl-D-erythritol kinase [Sphingomicrobium sp.]